MNSGKTVMPCNNTEKKSDHLHRDEFSVDIGTVSADTIRWMDEPLHDVSFVCIHV